MKTAESWFDEGLAALELARGADRVSELMGDYERAVHAFEQALALDPAHSGAIRERALTLSKRSESTRLNSSHSRRSRMPSSA